MASSARESGTTNHDAPARNGSEQNCDVTSSDEKEEGEESEVEESSSDKAEDGPPLPDEAPPLPDEQPPLPDEQPPDDGWEPVWDATAQAFYFYNRITKATQWENPRVPQVTSVASGAGLGAHDRIGSDSEAAARRKKGAAGGYNPAIHGDYDPNADYAQEVVESDEETATADTAANASGTYAATGAFNRFTGKWQDSSITPDNYNDENKSKRQMNAFFDVDAAANSHDGRSLKAERQNKKFSRKEIKAFKDKRRERKEEKRRAWLRD